MDECLPRICHSIATLPSAGFIFIVSAQLSSKRSMIQSRYRKMYGTEIVRAKMELVQPS